LPGTAGIGNGSQSPDGSLNNSKKNRNDWAAVFPGNCVFV